MSAFEINVWMVQQTPKNAPENSPAIYGWEQRNPVFKVPSGTAEHFFRP